jgi:hypothetical protein
MSETIVNRIIRCSEFASIALGVVIGAVYLDPMTINSVKRDFNNSISTFPTFNSYQADTLRIRLPAIDSEADSSEQALFVTLR